MILGVFLILTMICGVVITILSGCLTLVTRLLEYEKFGRFFYVTFIIGLVITVVSLAIIMIICL